MRIAGLVFSSIATFSIAAAVLTYVPSYIGQNRIYMQGSWTDTIPDTNRIDSGTVDRDHQRYYSETEGWTYYTLPAYSAVSGER
jgi:hypothetical protein